MEKSYVRPVNDPIMRPYSVKEFKKASDTSFPAKDIIVIINGIASMKVKNLIRNVNIKLRIQIPVKRKRIRRERKYQQKLKLPSVLLTPMVMILIPMSSSYAVMMTMTSWMINSIMMG